MGWWSADVLGGDCPLDYLAVVEDRLGVSELYPLDCLDEPARRELATCLAPDVVEALRVEFSSLKCDSEVALQVLGVVVMASGAAMSDALRASVVHAAKADEWASEDPERREAMETLVVVTNSYLPGVPVIMKHTGLFEAISQNFGTA